MKIITTDYIITAAILYFFLKGWSRGFLRILIGPISLIIGCVAGFTYYQKTQDLATSLLISVIGPIVLNIFVSLALKIWRKAVCNTDSISLLSRLLGSALSVLWGSGYIAMLLILIGMVPVRLEWFKKIQHDVTASKSYALVYNALKDKIPMLSMDMEKMTRIFQDPAQIEQFRSSGEFQNLMEDKQLKALFSDEEIVEQMQNKNYSQLLSNPKIQAVFQNQELLEKMFAVNRHIMENSFENEATQGGSDRQPKWIDIKSK